MENLWALAEGHRSKREAKSLLSGDIERKPLCTLCENVLMWGVQAVWASVGLGQRAEPLCSACAVELSSFREGWWSQAPELKCPLVAAQSLTSFSSGTTGATGAARQMCDLGLLLFYSLCHLVTPYFILFYFLISLSSQSFLNENSQSSGLISFSIFYNLWCWLLHIDKNLM